MRIAFLGTRGAPARYGGFETAVEQIGQRLVTAGNEVVVYCRNPGQSQSQHLGMELVNLPALRTKHAETLSHTALSVRDVRHQGCDAAIVFNAANSPFIGALQRQGLPTALHMDGLEWKRSKWSGAGRKYYLLTESHGVRRANQLIADAVAIQDYYRARYGVEPVFIPYGAPIISERSDRLLQQLDLYPHQYHLVVSRLEPENNVHLLVQAYVRSQAKYPLVVVGSVPYNDAYAALVSTAASSSSKVRLVGSIWDQDLLDQLYLNSLTYLHGHSVGGTNPSLLRAGGAGAAVVAYDVVFNREVLGPTGEYFSEASTLSDLIREAESRPEDALRRGMAARARIAVRYDWDVVAGQYEELCKELVAGGVHMRSARSSRQPSPEISRGIRVAGC